MYNSYKMNKLDNEIHQHIGDLLCFFSMQFLISTESAVFLDLSSSLQVPILASSISNTHMYKQTQVHGITDLEVHKVV